MTAKAEAPRTRADSGMLTRTAQIVPSSLNEEARTVDVVWTTGARVLRQSWDGPYIEELIVSREAVDLQRLNAGAPLLNGHRDGNDVLKVLGNVVKGSAQIANGEGTARVRFDEADDEIAEKAFRKVKRGIVSGVSVGYAVLRIERTKELVDGIPVYRVTKWEPLELSLAPIQADLGSHVRGNPMPGLQTTPEGETHNDNNPDANPAADPTQIERTRAKQIRNLGQRAHLDSSAIDALIDSGVSLEAARSQILETVIARDAAEFGGGGPNIDATRGHWEALEGRGVEDRLRDAFAGQVRGGVDRLRDGRSQIVDDVIQRRTGWHDLARQCLSNAGQRVGFGSPAQMLKRAMSTSDFPALLADVANKSIRRGYENEPASHLLWVRTSPVPDFKAQHRPILGAAPDLEPVLEGGEYTHGSLDEDSTSYRVGKLGKIISLTWEAMVNDDTRAFLDVASRMGGAALRAEGDAVYSLFAENAAAGPTMQDEQVLFHSDHANLTSAGTFDAALLAAGRVLLRKQTGVGGGILSLQPRGLVVPAELEHAAELLLAAATRIVSQTQEAATPKWLTGLTLVVEPRLPANAVYLTADPVQIDSCELGRLEEHMNGPTVEEEREFDRDVFRWKVRHVFGAKFLDWRGIVKMPVSGG